MTSLSRRRFLQGMAATPVALWLPDLAHAAQPRIRYDIASPNGQAMLAIYADAVRLMLQRPQTDPRSWLWQWYTHFVDGATTKANEISRIFGTATTPERTLATEVWNTCQSHSGQNYNHFFPWHRILLMFHEDIIRNITGRTDFTLPYWNYTSPDPAKRGIVPLQFRLPNDPVWGPLYRPERTFLANSGQRIDKNQPGDQMDISVPMACTSYSNVGTVMGFCRSIDSGIHGRVHVLSGMGKVPYSGRDPLFFVHHANVDRMWAFWTRNGGSNPTTATWATKVFPFVGGQGQRVTGMLKDYFDLSTLGYTYDDLIAGAVSIQSSRLASTNTLRLTSTNTNTVPEQVARGISEANLGTGPVRVRLQRVAGAQVTDVMGLSNIADGKRTYLVLKNLHTWSQPEVLYHVYLTPGGGSHGPERASYVGAINFFDAEFHDHGNGDKGDVLGENFYSFDVTEMLQRIAHSGRKAETRDSLCVTFVPAGTPTLGGNPMVGTIELARQ